MDDQAPVPGGVIAIRNQEYVIEERVPGPPPPKPLDEEAALAELRDWQLDLLKSAKPCHPACRMCSAAHDPRCVLDDKHGTMCHDAFGNALTYLVPIKPDYYERLRAALAAQPAHRHRRRNAMTVTGGDSVNEPTTKAGRELAGLNPERAIEFWPVIGGFILAIETEARADALDVDVLAKALDTCLPGDFSDHAPGNRVRAKAIAREYRAILNAEVLR